MTKFKEWNYGPGSVDIICAGTPCQAFSIAGLRKGLDDPRGNLTLVFLGILAKIKPSWIIWENVPGALSDNTNAFGQFQTGLSELGYQFCWRILDAQYFGVPQRRRRIFLVGYLGDWRPPFAVLFERESLQGNITPRKKEREGDTGTFTTRSGKYGGGKGYLETCNCIGAELYHHGTVVNQDVNNNHIIAQPICISGAGERSLNGNGKGWKQDGTSFTLNKTEHHAVAIENHAQDGRFQETNVFKDMGARMGTGGGNTPMVFNPSGYRRGHEVKLEEISGTVKRSKSKMGDDDSILLSSMQVRRITPKECERLQGFPDDYTNIPYGKGMAADSHRYKALGNSMAVPVVRWIGQRIKMVEEILNP